MCASCTIDNITSEVDEVDLEITREGIEIFGIFTSANSNFQDLINYLETRDNSDNTIRSVRIQDARHKRMESCNGIFGGMDYNDQGDGSVRFRIRIREVPDLTRS